MPFFRRSDGVPVKDVSPERRLLPLLLRGRNESAVYHRTVYDISKARMWLRSFNRAGSHQSATLFHLFLWAMGYGFHRKPAMNRFVSGGRLYQRNQVSLSFAAKKTFSRDEPLVTVKLPFPDRDEPLLTTTDRIARAIDEGRAAVERPIDKEIRWSALFPLFVVRLFLAVLRILDRWNLLPASQIRHDPLYSSAFVANLGSVGLDDSFHHFYETGTVGIFAVLGTQKKTPFVTRQGTVEVRDGMTVNWTLDERIADGFVSGDALRYFRDLFEDPEKHLGPPEQAAGFTENQRSEEAA